ncbi:MAG: DNA repair protein RadA, partial [Chloroflexota bacterium]|nr:DNA repair protein RadA [Chloroflexota bacterium]
MPKTRTQYVCQECGRTSPRELGRCPGCGTWNSMLEAVVQAELKPAKRHAARGLAGISTPKRLAEIGEDIEERIPLSLGEFARVLGGGV